MEILLASSSLYRQRLLARLGLDFRCVAPDIDEQPLAGETAVETALRLARAKASTVAAAFPRALVIGSDQVASIGGRSVGKPGNFAGAMAQLKQCAGREVSFHTAVAITCLARNLERFHVEPFSVHFRRLSDRQIAAYLQREHPFDCAGSFKVEGLGIALFESMSGRDPTSLEGLPLIVVTELLNEAGIDVLAPALTGM